MATAMATPASNCLAQKLGASGSCCQTRFSPSSPIAAQACPMSICSACSTQAALASRPISMPLVCRVSVQTMALTPPSIV